MLLSKMAAEGGGKEMNEIKTQFTTREGLYKLLSHSEYSRPNRVPFNSQGSNPVRVSFVNVNDQSGNGDRLCFNVGRELYFYIYKGVRKAADLSKPIDKRIYKGTQPTCHDFNHLTATAESVSLLVGFSAGQVQLIDPIKKETSKLFNEERLIDKSRVTCVKWVPGSESLFLVAHSSGNMYLYNVEHTCGTTVPHYQLLKQGESFAVHTCKSKSTRNPLLKWTVEIKYAVPKIRIYVLANMENFNYRVKASESCCFFHHCLKRPSLNSCHCQSKERIGWKTEAGLQSPT
ncbi:WD repeat-containing protein 20 isoform X8 [Strigops habroptila]|uniref:WD repeat-containing protein 20 isoform X8 n=1 Tax=Strigops habroptila TaxID=2489341 RepID=UPI0011CFECE0|nr:WD repeat-containing protein 20 isoform X8 [Strigops habroptila]